jgi:hypothetical protein
MYNPGKQAMKKLIALTLAAAATAAVAPAFAQISAGVSIGINQPGVYGRIDIGAYPQPVVVNPQPIVVAPPVFSVPRQPIYLYVPVEAQRNWARYCGNYNACNQPVYFVQENWVRERYLREHPNWHERGGPRGPRDRDHDRR